MLFVHLLQMPGERATRFVRLLTLISFSVLVSSCGGGGSSAPAPTVSLKASATDVATNGSVTLSWTSTEASSCTATGGWSGSLSASGSKTVSVPQTSTYSISCSGAGGSTPGNVTVTAWKAPTAIISADSANILANNTVSLTWSSQNAKTCSGGDALSGSLPTSGSKISASLTTTTVFSVSCSNPVFTAFTASVTVNVSTTFSLAVTVQYQVPGTPVVNAAKTFYVPDWAHPVTHPVPFVSVELQHPAGTVVQQVFADANGVAKFSGLDPTVTYTPVVRAKIQQTSLGLDFEVANNTAPIDTSQPTYRARYAPYANSGSVYTPDKRMSVQADALTAPDGWDSVSQTLVDANRIAGPYALLANAVTEAQIVSAAIVSATIGRSVTWRPLTILWSVKNKGGLAAPPNNMDHGFVTGSGGYYNSTHPGVDTSGLETGATISEDLEFISGDVTTEPMEIYPFVLTHEMGHFTQTLFSTRISPGFDHQYSDYEDPTQAWIEGNASGIAALVLNTPQQNRLATISGEIVVGVYDISNNTINGNPQTWPVGWYQESTVTHLMWSVYDLKGSIKLSAAATLAPMYTATWQAGPWLNSPWAYTAQLANLNPASATAIGTLGDSLSISSTGDDEWGSTETHPGNRTAQDALPPYVTVPIGGAGVTICSAGAPLEYNKESNVRYVRVPGDGNTHTFTIQGPTGTVPTVLRGFLFTPGANLFSQAFSWPLGYTVFSIGDCGVANSPFTTGTAACNEPAVPPVEQCWTVSVQ